jgi:predicted HicB family RNase H-like nuclease
MIENKRNKIPAISPERLDTTECDASVGSTREEQKALAFLKGKEVTQPFTIRIPTSLYQELRKAAFDKNIKINQIIVGLIKNYISNK